MRCSKYQDLLALLLKEPIFKASDARSRGIPSRMPAYFCRKGMIERVGRGLYRVAGASSGVSMSSKELVLFASSIPRGPLFEPSLKVNCYPNSKEALLHWLSKNYLFDASFAISSIT